MAISINSWLTGLVAPWGYKAPGTEIAAGFDTRGALLTNGFGGPYAELCRQGKVYYCSKAAFTMPVNAATLGSLFTIYNPPGSNVNLEMIETNVATVTATTVVDGCGRYYSSAAQTAAGTFTTLGTVSNALLNGPTGQAQFYSSYTASGTPALGRLVGGWGAVTDPGPNTVTKDFWGSLIVPPGTAVHLAMTTAASTGSGITADTLWAEIPIS